MISLPSHALTPYRSPSLMFVPIFCSAEQKIITRAMGESGAERRPERSGDESLPRVALYLL